MLLRYLCSILIVVFCAVFSFAQAPNLMEPDKEVAVLQTSMGKIVLELFPAAAPKHVKNFKQLSRSGFYNGTKFHRVIPGFMIQGGDPNSKDQDRSNDGTGNSGTKVPAEFTSIPHKRGILSMARSSDPNSASCQFFIVVKDSNFLDNQYSVFGRVIEGMDVADKIVDVKRDDRDNPINAVTIQKITIEARPAAK
jgi:peptidyl-prolyl cis-trans isomerase B (cyclophilin B)